MIQSQVDVVGIWSCGCHMHLGNYLLHCMFLVLLSATIVAMAGGDCWFIPWSMARVTAPFLAVVVGSVHGGDLVIAPDTAILNRSNWSVSSVFNTLEDAKDLRAKCLQLQHDGLLKVGGHLAVDIETHGA